MVASHTPATGDLARNPGMCPRLGIEVVTPWFSSWHSTTEPHQPGQVIIYIYMFIYIYNKHIYKHIYICLKNKGDYFVADTPIYKIHVKNKNVK